MVVVEIMVMVESDAHGSVQGTITSPSIENGATWDYVVGEGGTCPQHSTPNTQASVIGGSGGFGGGGVECYWWWWFYWNF